MGILIIFISGCTAGTERGFLDIANSCKKLCQDAKSQNIDLSNGPCLSDNNKFAAGWVCDIAHSPRAEADNNPANQCIEFREGKASHFVEVDENCNMIKYY